MFGLISNFIANYILEDAVLVKLADDKEVYKTSSASFLGHFGPAGTLKSIGSFRVVFHDILFKLADKNTLINIFKYETIRLEDEKLSKLDVDRKAVKLIGKLDVFRVLFITYLASILFNLNIKYQFQAQDEFCKALNSNNNKIMVVLLYPLQLLLNFVIIVEFIFRAIRIALI